MKKTIAEKALLIEQAKQAYKINISIINLKLELQNTKRHQKNDSSQWLKGFESHCDLAIQKIDIIQAYRKQVDSILYG